MFIDYNISANVRECDCSSVHMDLCCPLSGPILTSVCTRLASVHRPMHYSMPHLHTINVEESHWVINFLIFTTILISSRGAGGEKTWQPFKKLRLRCRCPRMCHNRGNQKINKYGFELGNKCLIAAVCLLFSVEHASNLKYPWIENIPSF